MNFVLILHMLFIYQLGITSLTETSSSTFEGNLTSSEHDQNWNTATGSEEQNITSLSSSTADEVLFERNLSSSNYSNSEDVSPNSTNLETVTTTNRTEAGNNIFTPIEHITFFGPNEGEYSLSFQVDACGIFCDGFQKSYKMFPLCGHYRCIQCYCDDLCTLYGDCCPDENGTVPHPVLDENITCVGPDSFSTYKSYYMIKGCPSNDAVIGESQNESLHPVTSLLTNLTYFNEVYALCNNDTDFVPWLNHTSCLSSYNYYDNTDDNTELQHNESDDCMILYTPSPSYVIHRICSWHRAVEDNKVIDTCNVSGSEETSNPSLQELCHSTVYPVGRPGHLYNNIFCYICNGEKPPSDCGWSEGLPQDAVVSIDELTNFVYFSTSETSDTTLDNNCTDSEWQELASKTCRKIRCMNGRYLAGEKCEINNHTLDKTEYTIYVHFPLRSTSMANQDWTDVVYLFRDNVPRMIAQFEPLIYYFYVDNLIEHDQNNFIVSNDTVGLTIVFRSMKEVKTFDYENDIIKFVWDDWIFLKNDTEIVLKPKPWEHLLLGEWHMFTFDPVNKTCCSSTNYHQWLFELEGMVEGFTMFPQYLISLSDALSCPFIRFNQDEYDVSVDGHLRLVSSNITIQDDNHYKFGYDLQICLSTLRNWTNGENGFDFKRKEANIIGLVKGYLSLVCICISLISILLTLITFFRFPTLLTLPNKNTMFLAMSIFAAQATFQFGAGQTGDRTLCQIVGIVIHFLWLSVVYWTNVCCFHMFRVFASSSKAEIVSYSHWRSLLKYAFYVYGMSSAIVSATIGTNYAVSNGKSLGYGDRLCYINDAIVIGLAFVLPLGITILVNIFFFSWTVCTIYQVSKVHESSSTDRSNVFVYIKLSTLTGGFWILVILAEVTGIEALSFLSIILNGCQGLFIFISYVLNRRVYRMWVGSCRKTTKPRPTVYTLSESTKVG